MPYTLRASILTSLLFLSLMCVLAQDSQEAESRFNRGDEYLQLNNYAEAIREFEKALSLKPNWAEAYFKLGVAHSKIPFADKDRSAHNKAAIKAFQAVVRLKPTWAEAHNELGRRVSELGKSEEAVKSFKEAIRLKPDLADAHINLAIANLYKARYTEGIESLKEDSRSAKALMRVTTRSGSSHTC